jgi:Uncharacterized conserved protein
MVLALGAAEPDAAYVAQIEKSRAERLARLMRDEGWLTLVGLHFLEPGSNTVGSAADNTIVLKNAPAHVGTIVLNERGVVTLTVNPAEDVRVEGEQVLTATLREAGAWPATRVSFGTVSFFVIDRGGRKALRVRDTASERRKHFAGIEYFPIDPTWRIEADWEWFERPREVMIKNILGQEMPALVPGKAVFEREGKTFELLPLVDGSDDPMMFVISDLTSGVETYGAARFVYADPPRGGKVVLDFNEAINPPCAFTPFATCPLPPKENRMEIAVRAGEKDYRGEHE